MTKADWLDFFEAINGRSATEAAPVQEAPAQPIFAGA